MEKPEAASSFELIMHFEDAGFDETARQNRQAVADAYRAMQRGDIEAWGAMFDPQVRFHEAGSLPYGGVYEGIQATRRGCDAMFAEWETLHVEIEELPAAGGIVFAYLTMTARARKTGKQFSFPVAELFRFRDGKVIEWRPIYWDTHLAREAAGA